MRRMARILLTGGAGFIGSHTAVALLERGYDVVLLDDFSNAARDVPERLHRLSGVRLPVIEVDIRDQAALAAGLAAFEIDAVIHFAAKKAVGESEADPLLYYDSNIIGTIRLLAAMRQAGIDRLVFSSSATVYGAPDRCPIDEAAPLRVTNIYGRTKLVMEGMITDLVRTRLLRAAAVLRYFNPVGAHPSALIGEDPSGVPANLMPFLCQVAAGQRAELAVFGDDYPTRDGSGVRDFIHIMDLAEAHVAAVARVLAQDGALTVNLGTGIGYSVFEMIKAFERVNGVTVPYRVAPRRAGDVAECYADPGLAAAMLGWQARFGIEAMCRDAWLWQSGGAVAKRGGA